MCLANVFQIKSIKDHTAVCECCGITRSVRLDLVPAAKTGDYVLSHAGFAIEILKEEQAKQNLAAIEEVLHAV